MNIRSTIAIYGGGPGSGCNPQVGKCGRPMGPGGPSPSTWDMKESTKQFYLDQDGHYLPDRAKIHDDLILKYEHKPTQTNPAMTVLLGGSASGKSTYDEIESAKLRNPAIIDVDKMRADLPEFAKVAGTPGSELVLDEARDVRAGVMMSALAHNNDIALEAVGHPSTPGQIDDIEKTGYKVNVVYVHRPVDESISLANKRAESSPTMSGRIKPPETEIRDNHAQTRSVLPQLMKPGRDVLIYDGTGDWDPSKQYPVIYHRAADGTVDVKNDVALERMRNAEDPKIPDVF